jgi:glycosyltransferase involved in cell wall biosynthesis
LPVSEVASILEKFGLTEKYVFYAGPLESRKNVEVLASAHAHAVNVLRKRGVAAPLLVATGTIGAGGEKFKKSLAKLSDGLFTHLGYVDRKTLRALYSGCTVFCYPSRYEGFGLPPLEAMSCGKAVIVANAASLPEVVGDAGILVEPDDVQGWSQEILRCLTDEKYRQAREIKSIEQSGKFSVEKMCREVMEGYTKAIQ